MNNNSPMPARTYLDGLMAGFLRLPPRVKHNGKVVLGGRNFHGVDEWELTLSVKPAGQIETLLKNWPQWTAGVHDDLRTFTEGRMKPRARQLEFLRRRINIVYRFWSRARRAMLLSWTCSARF